MWLLKLFRKQKAPDYLPERPEHRVLLEPHLLADMPGWQRSLKMQMLTEVPVTPETRVTDVVEFCKEAGEAECHLAEVWDGRERALPQDLLLLDLLQQWGARRPEVRFFLRHCPPWPQGKLQQQTDMVSVTAVLSCRNLQAEVWILHFVDFLIVKNYNSPALK
uniref:Apoptosis-stimulating of p53 protein 2-like RA domain-containing protein n=1 Tax=Fundulus heteroclitus TaxID=8078 RepID=A0A3Q2Q225_FUNHE